VPTAVYALDTRYELISVFRCFRGPISFDKSRSQNAHTASICTGQYPVLSVFQTVKWVMPLALDLITPEAGAIYSWIAAMLIFRDFM